MKTAKEQVRRMLDGLPDGVSLEDIQHHIYVLATVTRGLEDVEAERVLTAEDVEQRTSAKDFAGYRADERTKAQLDDPVEQIDRSGLLDSWLREEERKSYARDR